MTPRPAKSSWAWSGSDGTGGKGRAGHGGLPRDRSRGGGRAAGRRGPRGAAGPQSVGWLVRAADGLPVRRLGPKPGGARHRPGAPRPPGTGLRGQQCRDFLHQAAGGNHARRFRAGHRHQPHGALSHRPCAPAPSGQAGERRPGDHRLGLRPRRAARLGRLRGQQVRTPRDARLDRRGARWDGRAGDARVAGAGGYGDLGSHRSRFQDGVHQAEGHDARPGRGGGCALRRQPAAPHGHYGDSASADRVFGALMNVSRFSILGSICLTVPLAAQSIPQLPDSTGWGVHVLALARAPDSAIWAGTYGQGIFVLRPHATAWEHISESDDTSRHSISWDFVQALAFGPKGEVWYGTVGNGWGLSLDGGRTWKNWTYDQLGPEWQYVVPNGIAIRADTTVVATADGLQITTDDGAHWTAIGDAVGPPAKGPADTALPLLTNEYVRRLAPDRRGWNVTTLRGNQRLVHTAAGWQVQPLAAAAFPPANAVLIGRVLYRGTQCGLRPATDTLPCIRHSAPDAGAP